MEMEHWRDPIPHSRAPEQSLTSFHMRQMLLLSSHVSRSGGWKGTSWVPAQNGQELTRTLSPSPHLFLVQNISLLTLQFTLSSLIPITESTFSKLSTMVIVSFNPCKGPGRFR